MDSPATVSFLAHVLAAACSACGIIVLVFESPLDVTSIVLLVFFPLIIVWDFVMFGLASADVWTRARDEALKKNSVLGVAVLGWDPAEPLPVEDPKKMELLVRAEEARLYFRMSLGFVAVTIFFGTDAAQEVRMVNGGVAATLATFAALFVVVWAAAVRKSVLGIFAVDAALVSIAGVSLAGVLLSGESMDPLTFSLSWVGACAVAAGIRFAIVYASGTANQQPEPRRAGPFVFATACVFVWGLLVAATGYAVFNPGLYVATAFFLVFWFLELFWSSTRGAVMLSAMYSGSPKDKEHVSPIPVVVLWSFCTLIVLAMGASSVFVGVPYAVSVVLWVFVVIHLVLTFWVLFRKPARPKYAASCTVSFVAGGACLCAPPASNAGLAAPAIMLLVWLAFLLGTTIPDLVSGSSLGQEEMLAEYLNGALPSSAPHSFADAAADLLGTDKVNEVAEEVSRDYPNHRVFAFKHVLCQLMLKRMQKDKWEDEDARVVAGSALGNALVVGLLGFGLAMAPGRAVLSVYTAAFAALLTWTIVNGIMAIIACFVFAQRLSATTEIRGLLERPLQQDKKDQ